MSMELSNQKKLSEFYEELKRLKIKIIRPDLNKSFADFSSDGENFYYALGAIKNVGFEAISNILNERERNGKFKSFSDFINRVDAKDINKLQLEGLTKAGAFDELNKDRGKIFNSIPKIIQQIKKINDVNKSELIMLTVLAFFIIFFGFYPMPLMETFDISVNSLIDNYQNDLNANQL